MAKIGREWKAHSSALILITRIFSGVSAILGLLVVIGWYSRNETLIQVVPYYAPLQFNTALGFLLCGIGLFAATFRKIIPATICGGAAAALGGLTLIQYLANINFGIDSLLFDPYITVETSHRGRMAPNTAICFLLCGIAVVFAARRRRVTRQAIAEELLGFSILSLAVMVFCGYLFGAEPAYGWGNLTRMAIHTAFGFTILGTGILTYVWSQYKTRQSSIPVYIPVIICFLGLMFDFSTPPEVVAGIVYIPLVFCAIWFVRHSMAFVFAAVGSLLNVLGYYTTEAPAFSWVAFLNMVLTISALWVVATLVYIRKKTESNLELANVRLKTAHGQLNDTNEELRRSNEELDNFAYIASHDLREPLRGINNQSRFLLEDYRSKLDESGVKKLNRLIYLASRLDMLISDLLYFSRIGREKLAIQPTDLNAVVEDVRKTMESSLPEGTLKVAVPVELPTITCAAVRVTELFRNLFENAVKYNDNDVKKIEVGTIKQDGEDVIYVKDNGIGIDSEFFDDIFRIFKRLHSEKRYGQGTGSGLTFVKKIVEQHGGHIWLESRPGEGTTFFFTLTERSDS